MYKFTIPQREANLLNLLTLQCKKVDPRKLLSTKETQGDI